MEPSPFRYYFGKVYEVQGGACLVCKELSVCSEYEAIGKCQICKKQLRTSKQAIPQTLYYIKLFKRANNISDLPFATEGWFYDNILPELYFTENDAITFAKTLDLPLNKIYKIIPFLKPEL